MRVAHRKKKMLSLVLAAAAVSAVAVGALVSTQGCGGEKAPAARVFVLGLDGATFDLIGPWLERGELPNLRSFLDRSAWGILESVVPPMSPPAWMSAVTGVNPGKHAIYDWYRRLPNSRALVSETSKSLRTKAVWTLLSEAEHPVGVINVPLTDPPAVVNGFMISGMPHTDPEGYTYPRELRGTLGGYMTDSMGDHLEEDNADELLEKLMKIHRERVRVTLDLMKERPWDLFWVVFTVTDRVQHFYWKFMDENHPDYDPAAPQRLKDAIFDMWKTVDESVGRILEAMPPDATVILMSDHGFGPIYKEVRLHNLVRGRDLEGPPICYTDGAIAQLIYIDLEGRLPYGVVPREEYEETRDKIKRMLLELRDPETGEGAVDTVYKREEIFSGRYVSKAADLVAVEKPFYYMQGDTVPGRDALGKVSTSFSAFHRPNGIVAVSGAGVRAGKLAESHSILDVTPTILYLLGEPVRRYMDGEVMEAVFDRDFLSSHPVRYSEEGAEIEETEYTDEELEKLKAVPYLR